MKAAHRGELVCVCAALLAHAGFFALGAFIPDRSLPPEPAGVPLTGVIDVTVVSEAPAIAPERPSSAGAHGEAMPAAREGSAREGPLPRAPSWETGTPGTPSAVPAPGPVASADEYGGAPPPGPLPGLGGAPIYVLPGVLTAPPAAPPAPTRPPPPRPVDQNIAGKIATQGVAAKDRQLGLDLPGASNVASALVEAVRGSTTPVVARGTFVVRLGPGGEVVSVRAMQWTDGVDSAWQQAAASALASLASQRFRMPPTFAAGATVTVIVDSMLTKADGTVVAQAGKKRSDGGGPSGGGIPFDLSGGNKLYRVIHPSVQVSP